MTMINNMILQNHKTKTNATSSNKLFILMKTEFK